ncbi:MAG TPA: 23S rRNA (guanosine(2251)-2'-O)-methyltransferase RlmB [Chlamydiales bacterium]|nr:23S rRNA (guanosine(2251)-2'-O)-methyltransferase RlmB [Chlamydiales bacterium]
MEKEAANLIYGVHAVREVLLHAPHRLIRVILEEGRVEKKEEIVSLCQKAKIPLQFVSKERLNRMTNSSFHQSMAAEIKQRVFLDVKGFLKLIESKENALILMLDQIFDPQNFGSLIRSAECFGADGIVWSKNRGTDLTSTVVKASCGASELLSLVRISNLAQAVEEFQKAGFSAIAALVTPSSENAFTFHFPPKTLLIVGSEGEGIQPLIQKKADHSLYIPMQGKIASLNVSNAAAILLALYRQETRECTEKNRKK